MKTLRITVDGKVYEVQVEIMGQEGVAASGPITSGTRSAAISAPVAAPAAAPKPAAAPAGGGDGSVVSPLAAVVVSVDVTVGQSVKAGDKLITLEAMKMNTFVNAPADGKVEAILVDAGASVEEGQPLATVK